MKIPRNWVRADAVRVRKVNGKNVVEIKRNPAKKKRKAPRKRTTKRKRMLRNVAGFMDQDGEFHPIRHSKGYSPEKAGDFASHYTGAKYKKKPTKKKTAAKRKRGRR